MVNTLWMQDWIEMKNFFIKRMIKNLTDLQIIFLSFLFVVILGGSILSLPISSRTGEYTSFVDSIFTAISATCVTGLAVLDTSTYWSFFGQVIILILIQVGGLGFMTLVASIFLLLNQKVSMKSRTALHFMKRNYRGEEFV